MHMFRSHFYPLLVMVKSRIDILVTVGGHIMCPIFVYKFCRAWRYYLNLRLDLGWLQSGIINIFICLKTFQSIMHLN